MSREQSKRTTPSSSKVHSTKEDRRGHEHIYIPYHGRVALLRDRIPHL